MPDRRLRILLTDLIDLLTIIQIKESLFDEVGSVKATEEIYRIEADIAALLDDRRVAVTGRLMRLIVLLAQTNLQVWLNKDSMQNDPARYLELLEYAQELNGLRNHVRNILMHEFFEWSPASERATFLSMEGGRWYSRLLDDLNAIS